MITEACLQQGSLSDSHPVVVSDVELVDELGHSLGILDVVVDTPKQLPCICNYSINIELTQWVSISSDQKSFNNSIYNVQKPQLSNCSFFSKHQINLI